MPTIEKSENGFTVSTPNSHVKKSPTKPIKFKLGISILDTEENLSKAFPILHKIFADYEHEYLDPWDAATNPSLIDSTQTPWKDLGTRETGIDYRHKTFQVSISCNIETKEFEPDENILKSKSKQAWKELRDAGVIFGSIAPHESNTLIMIEGNFPSPFSIASTSEKKTTSEYHKDLGVPPNFPPIFFTQQELATEKLGLAEIRAMHDARIKCHMSHYRQGLNTIAALMAEIVKPNSADKNLAENSEDAKQSHTQNLTMTPLLTQLEDFQKNLMGQKDEASEIDFLIKHSTELLKLLENYPRDRDSKLSKTKEVVEFENILKTPESIKANIAQVQRLLTYLITSNDAKETISRIENEWELVGDRLLSDIILIILKNALTLPNLTIKDLVYLAPARMQDALAKAKLLEQEAKTLIQPDPETNKNGVIRTHNRLSGKVVLLQSKTRFTVTGLIEELNQPENIDVTSISIHVFEFEASNSTSISDFVRDNKQRIKQFDITCPALAKDTINTIKVTTDSIYSIIEKPKKEIEVAPKKPDAGSLTPFFITTYLPHSDHKNFLFTKSPPILMDVPEDTEANAKSNLTLYIKDKETRNNNAVKKIMETYDVTHATADRVFTQELQKWKDANKLEDAIKKNQDEVIDYILKGILQLDNEVTRKSFFCFFKLGGTVVNISRDQLTSTGLDKIDKLATKLRKNQNLPGIWCLLPEGAATMLNNYISAKETNTFDKAKFINQCIGLAKEGQERSHYVFKQDDKTKKFYESLIEYIPPTLKLAPRRQPVAAPPPHP